MEASRGQRILGEMVENESVFVWQWLFSSTEVNADVLLTLALQCLWPLAH